VRSTLDPIQGHPVWLAFQADDGEGAGPSSARLSFRVIEDVLADLESVDGSVHHLGLDRLSVAHKPVRKDGRRVGPTPVAQRQDITGERYLPTSHVCGCYGQGGPDRYGR
jgi:hypothetical protein